MTPPDDGNRLLRWSLVVVWLFTACASIVFWHLQRHAR